MDKAYGGDQRFALVAAKTDGGGVESAESYLTQRQINLNNWYIVSDEESAWYKVYDPKMQLFGMAIIGPNGGLIEADRAGRFFGDYQFTLPGKKAKLLEAVSKPDSSQMTPIFSHWQGELREGIAQLFRGQINATSGEKRKADEVVRF